MVTPIGSEAVPPVKAEAGAFVGTTTSSLVEMEVGAPIGAKDEAFVGSGTGSLIEMALGAPVRAGSVAFFEAESRALIGVAGLASGGIEALGQRAAIKTRRPFG